MKPIIARRVSVLPLALLGAVSWSAVAAAQTASAGPQIEEVVVTAQHRSERLQDVPITVSAVTADRAAALRVTSSQDLAAITPGLQFNKSQAVGTPFMRGIGNGSAAPGQESTVATYIDDVYMPLFGLVFSLNNIERVEVLKGPQGTLFGRNAVGGVVNIITRTPQHTAGAEAEVGYASYKTFEGKFYATGPLSDNVAADIALYARDQDEGWGTNLRTGGEAFGDGHEYAWRSKVLVDLSDDTKITLAGDYMSVRENLGIMTRLLPGSVGLDGTRGPAGFYDANSNIDSFNKTKGWGASLNVNHSVGDYSLVSVTSYRKTDGHVPFDLDYVPGLVAQADFNQWSESQTQEFRILSPTGQRLSWIAGVYYYHSASGYDPLTQSGPALGAFPRVLTTTVTTDSLAAFGQATFALGEQTNITGGLRYTRDRQKIKGDLVAGPTRTTASARETFPKMTYRISLDHRFSPEALVFASASRGFKSGVFASTNITAPPVRPEILDAYEIGLKSDLLDNRVRLNLSGFYMVNKDRQVSQIQGGTTLFLNAGKATIKGIDFDGELAATDNLSLQFSAEYLDATFDQFKNAPLLTPRPTGGNVQTARDADGNRLPQAPKVTYNIAAVYKIPIAVGGLQAAINYAYNDGYYYTADNTVTMPNFSLLNASLRWTSENALWSASVWGRNLLKEQYFSNIQAGPFGFAASPAAPRTFGVSLTRTFQ